MNKTFAVFEDNLIRDLFAEKLGLSIIDYTDVRFFSDKEDLFGAIDTKGCDLVFTDDSVVMDIRFVKRILEINSDTRIVVVFSKEDTSRGRLLFKLGVHDCVVKNDLSSEYLYELFLDRDFQSVSESGVKRRDEKLRELFWGNRRMTDSFSSLYRINKDRVYVSVIYMMNYYQVSRGNYNFGKPAALLFDKLSEYFRNPDNGEYFYNHYAQLVLLFSPSEEVNADYVVRETKKIMSALKSSMKLKMFALVDKNEYKFTEIRETWKERIEYTQYYFLCDKNFAYIDDLAEKFTEDFDSYEQIKVFQQTLNDFDKNSFDREIAKLLDIKPKVEDMKGLTDFFLTLYNEIKKLEVQYNVAFADDAKFKDIIRSGHLKQAAAYCQECVNKIMDGISESSRMSIHIKKYLENHIAENVTLKDLAINFNFEYNYSSKYFNKIMGMSFKKYFTNLRLEVAKNLLRTTKHKCYEIAAMCGYKNYEHFSRMFYKKYKIWPKQIK